MSTLAKKEHQDAAKALHDLYEALERGIETLRALEAHYRAGGVPFVAVQHASRWHSLNELKGGIRAAAMTEDAAANSRPNDRSEAPTSKAEEKGVCPGCKRIVGSTIGCCSD